MQAADVTGKRTTYLEVPLHIIFALLTVKEQLTGYQWAGSGHALVSQALAQHSCKGAGGLAHLLVRVPVVQALDYMYVHCGQECHTARCGTR